MPRVKIFFLPYISAALPNGSRNSAAVSRYDVATQLNSTALIENSLPIEGRAILIEEPIKGVRKALKVAISKTVFFREWLFI